ncbi:hypothetical protein [Actinacidiphila glaucinigra]|uniref:hypothetical protein n=1 Tax=Actinacidiphila glaucinigra TaxID=235986 RepID=UPI00371352E3
MTLPGPTEAREEAFEACLAEVVRSLGLDVGPGPGGDARRTWRNRARTALRTACLRGTALSEESFDALLRAAVHDPDPSFNRQFVEPALNAFGYARVRKALLGYLRTGTDHERAGAARAWYWSALPLRMPHVRAVDPGSVDRAGTDGARAVVAEWNEAALREFVGNEQLEVRRCILPGLPLRKSAYPTELHGLVDTAVALARSHPDAYIRHRVEHQVGD